MKRKRRLQQGATKASIFAKGSISAKVQRKMIGIRKRLALQERKTHAQRDALKALEDRKANSNLFHCCLAENGNKFCTRGFKKKGNLAQHLKIGKHTMGVSSARPGKRLAEEDGLLCTTDRLKRLAADARVGAAGVRDGQVAEAVELRDSASYTLVTGELFQVPSLPAGWANKGKRSGKKRYTTAQLEFLRWCYTECVRDKAKKFTAEAAEKLMPLHGTSAGAKRYPDDPYWRASPEGRPTFRLFELLDHWTIKPWFSQQKAAFDKTLASALTGSTAKIQPQHVLDETFVEDEGADD